MFFWNFQHEGLLVLFIGDETRLIKRSCVKAMKTLCNRMLDLQIDIIVPLIIQIALSWPAKHSYCRVDGGNNARIIYTP